MMGEVGAVVRGGEKLCRDDVRIVVYWQRGLEDDGM